jgi:aminocarboxymuconate-semialdehyde decarboxylase
VERVALGTDYPFPLGEPVPGATIESLEELSSSAKDRLFRGTALEFLGLRPERFLP